MLIAANASARLDKLRQASMWRCARDSDHRVAINIKYHTIAFHANVGFREARSSLYMLVTAIYFLPTSN